MTSSNNLLYKSAEGCMLHVFLYLFICPAAWNVVDAVDLKVRAPPSKVENELEELKFSKISLIRTAMSPLTYETPDFT